MKYKLILLFLFLSFSAWNSHAQSNFVKRSANHFMLNNKPYYYVGANYWYGGLLALQKDPSRGKERVKKELDFLKSQGITSLRVLVGAEGQGLINGVQRVGPALQQQKGVFNDKVLESLDFLLAEMGKRKIYAVLYLSNNWEWSGGLLQYLNWNKQLSDEEMKQKMPWEHLRDVTSKFYTCEDCKADYAKQLKHVLNHKNKYTNRTYINETAIMAWELANEPRPMRPAVINEYKGWIKSSAQLIRSLDKNHLITLGHEGYMGSEDDLKLYKEIHSYKEVDYLTIHIWPKNWSWFRDTSIVDSLPQVINRTNNYIETHLKVAEELKKPLVIEEFGLPRDQHSFDPAASTSSRDKYFRSTLQYWYNSKQSNGTIGGISFWAFGGTSRPIPGQIFWKNGDDYSGDPPMEEQGLNTIFDSDKSTWKVIRSFTQP